MKEKSQLIKLILYLDTSEPEAVVAIYSVQGDLQSDNGINMMVQGRWNAGRELSATLSLKYKKILEKANIAQSDLSGIVVFSGPGSFTGLRIGISFANGLAYALSIPIYETRVREKLVLDNPRKIITPFYGSEPKITESKNR